MKTVLYILGILALLLLWGISGQIGREAGKPLAGKTDNAERNIESIVKEMADGVSKGLPMKLNSELKLNGVYAHGKTINYQLIAVNYVDGSASKELISQAVDATNRAALTTMCTGKMAPFLKMGAIVIYHYYDSQGTYLRNLTIETSYSECIQAGLGN